MSNLRLIARLDIKGPNLIKGIHLEGLRKLGDPNEYARRYYNEGIDEIIYMDVVASLYNRDNILSIVEKTAQNVFIPITVGGGVRKEEDVKNLLRLGADKVAVNTAAVKNPELIRKLSERFGSQCIVLSIEAKKRGNDGWEAYIDNGRECTGLDAVKWAKQAVELGVGEVLVTSVDREGTKKGFDIELTKKISENVNVPVIACGGMGCIDDVIRVVKEGKADAVAMASVLHYNILKLNDIREKAEENGLQVRKV